MNLIEENEGGPIVGMHRPALLPTGAAQCGRVGPPGIPAVGDEATIECIHQIARLMVGHAPEADQAGVGERRQQGILKAQDAGPSLGLPYPGLARAEHGETTGDEIQRRQLEGSQQSPPAESSWDSAWGESTSTA